MVSMTTHVPLPTPRLNEATVRVRDALTVAFVVWVPVALVLSFAGWRDDHHLGNVFFLALFALAWLGWSPAKWYGARLTPEEQYSWAWHLFYGIGRAKNLPEARRWAALASDGGYAPAWTLLGVMAQEQGDLEQGLKWFKRSAQSGEFVAQRYLGQMYLAGEGVPRDPATGLDWLTRAANQGDPDAEVELGFALGNGQHLEPRLDLAVPWFLKAAAQHQPVAMENLGEAYFELSQDGRHDVESLKWYLLAMAHGMSLGPEQSAHRDTLTSRMAENQIQKAERAAKEWLEANPAPPDVQART